MSKGNWILIGVSTVVLIVGLLIYAYTTGIIGAPEGAEYVQEFVNKNKNKQSMKEKASERGNTAFQQAVYDGIWLYGNKPENDVTAEQSKALKKYFGVYNK